MAMVVFLLSGSAADVSLGHDTARRLAELGVARLTFLRDAQGVAVVIEGWAFDVERCRDALAILGGGTRSRILHAVADTSLAQSLRDIPIMP